MAVDDWKDLADLQGPWLNVWKAHWAFLSDS